ncbi:uncharacterized protein LOC8085375 [Sorghum bicolor]|uniref:uncharacterized protein LOC8085375 n=1 Tax=Sorghum bicolor TaxID=4558 RepID=UPI000B423947|nr:uncharacterized protein LOC8085375 [Sorghum bicolor]|eukprot:XP_002437042.2 uncharacterized protein LOC8085375 [Sorghum bicolor]
MGSLEKTEYRNSWMYGWSRIDEGFRDEVDKFIEAAEKHALTLTHYKDTIICPCKDCKNLMAFADLNTIRSPLIMRGFVPNYTVWTHHGETTVIDDGNFDLGDAAEAERYMHQYTTELEEEMGYDYGNGQGGQYFGNQDGANDVADVGTDGGAREGDEDDFDNLEDMIRAIGPEILLRNKGVEKLKDAKLPDSAAGHPLRSSSLQPDGPPPSSLLTGGPPPSSPLLAPVLARAGAPRFVPDLVVWRSETLSICAAWASLSSTPSTKRNTIPGTILSTEKEELGAGTLVSEKSSARDEELSAGTSVPEKKIELGRRRRARRGGAPYGPQLGPGMTGGSGGAPWAVDDGGRPGTRARGDGGERRAAEKN